MTQVRRLMMGIGLSSLVLPSVLGVRLAGRSSHADSAWRLADGARRTAACEPLHGAWEPSRCAACRVAPPDRQGAGGHPHRGPRRRRPLRDVCGGATPPRAPRRARRDHVGKPAHHAASRSWHSTIWTDGRREPLMLGTGLNSSARLLHSPTYRPHPLADGAEPQQRRRHALREDRSRAPGIAASPCPFPNPGGGELHLFCWDKGIEAGYRLWSWTRHDDFIYFPQLAVGDVNDDGQVRS